MSGPWAGPLAALVIGALFGAVIQRGHFCTMGCVSDAVLFGSLRRGRAWALAAATALTGSQALDLAGMIDLAATPYRAAPLFWLGSVVGGLLFGFGMVLAGGCVSRNLARLGAGSLKALVTLLVTAVAALATLSGALAPLQAGLRAVGTVSTGADQGLPALAAAATGAAPLAASLGLTVGIAGALLAFALRDREFRRHREDLAMALLLGALVPLAWATAAYPAGLTFVQPAGEGLLWLTSGGALASGVTLVAGTVLGATVMAARQGSLRLEAFAGSADLVRHLAGGALMGVGGALAFGCTVGQGLTGAATLSLGSWLAVAAMLAGGWWGVKYLETGRVLPFLPEPAARSTG